MLGNSLDRLISAASKGRLVVFAGAGISVPAPTRLPGWYELQHQIAVALAQRLEALQGEHSLDEDVRSLQALRQAGQFPPEYQAQIIEEACGTRYFEGLQALDVTASNKCHRTIAALTNAGNVAALVTTNFDRLIERSLERLGAAYQPVIDEADFAEFAAQGSATKGPPIIKVHGCVSRASSMIDTLKQRLRGRREAVELAISRLEGFHWLFAGFSAADLNTNPDYLGLIRLMRRSAGVTYLARPDPSGSEPSLTPGARLLLSSAPGSADLEIGDAAEYLPTLCRHLQLDFIQDEAPYFSGSTEFSANLTQWANTLSESAAAVCISGIFEGAGMGERAARILHQLVDNIRPPSAGDPDWLQLQLRYGRIGAECARFTNVPNLQGVESNASVESFQSLLRASAGGQTFHYDVPLPAAWLWKGDGLQANSWAASHLNAILAFCETNGLLGKSAGRKAGKRRSASNKRPPITNMEDAADAWLSAAQVAALLLQNDIANLALGLARPIIRGCLDCGDPVRAARVVALVALIITQAAEDPSPVLVEHEDAIAEAARVGDGFHSGVLALAFGQYRLGFAGLENVNQGFVSREDNALEAYNLLDQAYRTLSHHAYRGWAIYAAIQQLKALADLRKWQALEEQAQALWVEVCSVSIHIPQFLVVRGQFYCMFQNFTEARSSFEDALSAAYEMGFLSETTELIQQYIDELPSAGSASISHSRSE